MAPTGISFGLPPHPPHPRRQKMTAAKAPRWSKQLQVNLCPSLFMASHGSCSLVYTDAAAAAAPAAAVPLRLIPLLLLLLPLMLLPNTWILIILTWQQIALPRLFSRLSSAAATAAVQKQGNISSSSNCVAGELSKQATTLDTRQTITHETGSCQSPGLAYLNADQSHETNIYATANIFVHHILPRIYYTHTCLYIKWTDSGAKKPFVSSLSISFSCLVSAFLPRSAFLFLLIFGELFPTSCAHLLDPIHSFRRSSRSRVGRPNILQ